MRKDKYKAMVKEHLKQSARNIERGRVKEIFGDEKRLVDEIGFRMSKNEVGHINEPLKTKTIPTPKLLIKYHNKLKNNGDLTTRLVILEKYFSDTLQMWVTWV